MDNIIRKTKSICPECNKILDATVFERDGKVMISKECPEHGRFEEVYWGSYEMYKKAEKFWHDGKGTKNPNTPGGLCPFSCGLCPAHKSHTALLNIVVTNRCDLQCWYCFFYSKKAGYVYEPTLEQIREMLRTAKREKPVPANAVQITGGEPTLRDDLLDIIKMAKEEGYAHVQLNTNGIRLSQDLELAKKIKEAGVNTLYLSFDGVTPKTNPKNHYELPNAVENCRKAGIGIVLVPTLINTVNDHEIGDMIRFGMENIDIVRGVNFQPISLVGRTPKREREKFRITIPDAIRKIEEQTNGEISKDDFYTIPSVVPITHLVEAIKQKPQYEFSCSPFCGMATYVFKRDDGKIIPITRFVDVDGFLEYIQCMADEINNSRIKQIKKWYVLLKAAKNIGKFIDEEKQPKGLDLKKILINIAKRGGDYNSLGKFHVKSMLIGMMHFQDKFNYDIQRVERCIIHYATPDRKIIPFCAFNVLPEIYRDKIQQEYGISIDEWEKKTGKKLEDDVYKRDTEKLKSSPNYHEIYKNFVK